MSFFNTAKTKAGSLLEGGSAWAQSKGRDIAGTSRALGGMAMENGPSMWKHANSAANGFLNPTAVGMGVGGAVGGTVGAVSDNGSFAGGFAGGAVLGGLGGAGYKAGSNFYKTSTFTNSVN